ncbi:hypothetical protein DL98DRAFT_57663 [Cadophora sp. DSE1049]|nr:hypothetical protein DL98DRAFT_57663 [Cadophora sp. DSE1049]
MRPTLTSTLRDHLFDLMKLEPLASYRTLLVVHTKKKEGSARKLRDGWTGRLSRSFISYLATLRASSNATSADSLSPWSWRTHQESGIMSLWTNPSGEFSVSSIRSFDQSGLKTVHVLIYLRKAATRLANSLKIASSDTHLYRRLSRETS